MIGKQYIKDLAKNSPMKFFTGKKEEEEEKKSPTDLELANMKNQFAEIIERMDKLEVSVNKIEKKQKKLNKSILKSQKEKQNTIIKDADMEEEIEDEKESISETTKQESVSEITKTDKDALELMKKLAKNGSKPSEIAKELNERGILNIERNSKWHWTQIRKILQDEGV